MRSFGVVDLVEESVEAAEDDVEGRPHGLLGPVGHRQDLHHVPGTCRRKIPSNDLVIQIKNV